MGRALSWFLFLCELKATRRLFYSCNISIIDIVSIIFWVYHRAVLFCCILLFPCSQWLPLSADNLFKWFGPRSGQTACQCWSGSKVLDTLLLKDFFKKLSLKKEIRWQQKHEKLPSMQRGNTIVCGTGLYHSFTALSFTILLCCLEKRAYISKLLLSWLQFLSLILVVGRGWSKICYIFITGNWIFLHTKTYFVW